MTSAVRRCVLTSLALAVTVVLAGCAGVPAPAATSAQTAGPVTQEPSAPTPDPTPVPVAETGETIPAQVFGGDCAAVFSEDEVGDIVGADVALYSESVWELSQAGGFSCIWRTEDYSTLVNLDFLPRASITATSETASCETGDGEVESSDWRCELEHEQSGIRVSGFLAIPGSEAEFTATAALAALSDQFDRRAAPDQAVPAPIPAADSWSNPVDCEALGAAVDLRPVFNNTPGFGWYAGGGDVFPSPARMELWGDSYALTCTWGTAKELSDKQLASGMRTGFSVQVYGGSAWAQQEVENETGATEVTMDGFDRVIRVKSGSGDTSRYGFAAVDGPNLLVFSSTTKKAGREGDAAALIAGYLDTH